MVIKIYFNNSPLTIRPEHETAHLLFVLMIPQTQDLTDTWVIMRDFIRKTNMEDDCQLAVLACVLHWNIKKENIHERNPGWKDGIGTVKGANYPVFLSNWLLALRGIVNIKLGEAHTRLGAVK